MVRLLKIIKDHLINIYKAFFHLAVLVVKMKYIRLLILYYLGESPLSRYIILGGISKVHYSCL